MVKGWRLFVNLVLLVPTWDALGQHTGATSEVTPQQKVLFYLHGGIVQEQGENAVSDQFGPYRYRDIVNTLGRVGFLVISEVRPKGTIEIDYAAKVATQIDSLVMVGIPLENIIVAGASQGAYIAVEVSWKMKNPRIRYVVMGLCWEYSLEYFTKYRAGLCGNFLSIYESSDRKGSCNELFKDKSCKTGYKEVRLDMGNGHGFLFKPYPEWILPLVEWSKSN